MINEGRWIRTLGKFKKPIEADKNQIDNNIWLSTISKKNNYNSVKKYSLLGALFVSGLLFVSVVKNEARNLQKELNNLKASINVIKYDLDQAILDHEVINSPENIAKLAKEHLDIDLKAYDRSQIKTLKNINQRMAQLNTIEKTKDIKKKKKTISSTLKIKEIKKLYNDPRSIPGEIKTHLAKKIEIKKTGLQKAYDSPKEYINLERVGKWSVVQVVKLFLGIPVIPGR